MYQQGINVYLYNRPKERKSGRSFCNGNHLVAFQRIQVVTFTGFCT
jgi:hypothetical protein